MQNLKKYWPFALVLVAVVFVVGLVLVVRGRSGNEPVDEEEQVADVPLDQRPVTMLVPRSDGHWLDLTVENVAVQGAASMEYVLLYTTADGRSQGFPSSPKPFNAGDTITNELLLGTTSSGKFYYDEGVETGEIDLKFRNDSGKLVGKLVSPWILRYEAESVEFEGFTYSLEDSEDIYMVGMNTFGLPGDVPGTLVSGPVGFFASDEVEGQVTASGGTIYRWADNEWQMVEAGSSVEPGIFITVTE